MQKLVKVCKREKWLKRFILTAVILFVLACVYAVSAKGALERVTPAVWVCTITVILIIGVAFILGYMRNRKNKNDLMLDMLVKCINTSLKENNSEVTVNKILLRETPQLNIYKVFLDGMLDINQTELLRSLLPLKDEFEVACLKEVEIYCNGIWMG